MKKEDFSALPLISNSGKIYSLSGIKRLTAALNKVDPGHNSGQNMLTIRGMAAKPPQPQENLPEYEQ